VYSIDGIRLAQHRDYLRALVNIRGAKLTTHVHLVLKSKNEWSLNLLPQYAFMAWCLVKAQGQFYLTFTLGT
jgi:hypothetical protein